MASILEITGDDIALWSQQFEAPGVLPDLVRRLLLATSPLSSISMNAHAGTRLRGWDGVVRSDEATAFCPAGLSVWELTVESHTRKLAQDFDKRLASATPFDLNATYVAVTARRFPAKGRWAADRALRRLWQDVRVLDADDLAAWLGRAPAVARWFADRLHRPIEDLDNLETWLDTWRHRTRPPLPLEMVVAGRERTDLARQIRTWARSANNGTTPLRVHGDTWDEAAAFVAVALSLDETTDGEQVRSRTVVARTERALRWALRADAAMPPLVVAAFEHASASLGPAVLPLEGPAPSGTTGVVHLPTTPFRRFAEVLVRGGMPAQEASRIAAQSGGKLSTLQRLLGHVEMPPWAKGAASLPLFALLLIEAFEPDNKEDRDVFSFMGVDPNEVVLLCERLRLSPDAPIQRDQDRYRAVWRWRAPAEAWSVLGGQIPAQTLRGFEETVRLVLGERDPSLDLPPDERFAAVLRGKVLHASPALREGLARSLARLSLCDEPLTRLHGPGRGSTLARIAVRDLLPSPWTAWASVSRLLPLLAEAAPEVFLDALEGSLRDGDGGVMHLLAQEGAAGFGASPHTGLLWALETLGWSESMMPRVASALAKLSEYDEHLERPGRLANRPSRSLAQILRIPRAQTRASGEQRIREMARRLEETPEVAFRMLVGHIDLMVGGMLIESSRAPEIWPVKPLSDDEQVERDDRELHHVVNAYLDMLFDHAGHDPSRWAYFLGHARMVPDLATRTVERLEQVQSEIRDERADLWASLRGVLRRLRPDGENDVVESGHETARRWKRLYELFTPEDVVARCAWLFARHVEMPEPGAARGDLNAQFQAADRLRSQAVEEIGLQEGRFELFDALARQAPDAYLVGRALGNSTFADELDTIFFEDGPSEALSRVMGGFVVARTVAKGNEWLESKLRSMMAQGKRTEVESALSAFGGTPAIWDIVDRLGAEVRHSYWTALQHVSGELSPDHWERAITNLLDCRNIVAAMETTQWAEDNVGIETVARTLAAFVGASADETRRFAQSAVSSYVLERLMDRLEAHPEVDARYSGLLANVELAYALLTEEPTRALNRLSGLFAASPDQFVELVKSMYRREGEPAMSLPEAEQDEVKRHAQAAYRMLAAWKGYPGQGRPPHEAEAAIFDWALKTLKDLDAEGRSQVGASEVARVLVRAPPGNDARWPNLAVRRLLELDQFPSLARGLWIAKRNARGPTSRSLGEGGRQERALAARFRQDADALRKEWPRTADVLDLLATDYERDARLEDEEARATMREEGAEPEDFGAAPPVARPTPKRRVLQPGIARVNRIEISDLAFFDRLVVHLKQPPPERGQWVVLLGDNGRGKSTLLRAIALALAGANVAQMAVAQARAPFIRVGRSSGQVTVWSADVPLSVKITNDGSGEAVTSEPADSARLPVFAYGCRRGSALGTGGTLDILSPFSDVATLFADSASLYSTPVWLKSLKLRALQERGYEEVYRTVVERLCGSDSESSLLPDIERLDVIGDQVWVIAPKLGGRIPLAALSDGYLTMLGWLVDLIARWVHWSEQVEGRPPTGPFFDRIEGVVLVDEIDLHLHPRWQRSVIRRLKDAFPRLSFVVTTHNPQTLLGAEAGEIVVLRDAADGGQEVRQFDVPPGTPTDQILSGEWFGLPFTVDDDTAALVREHQTMLLAGVSEDAPERVALEDKLAKRYGAYADTALDRMALEISAELMRERQPKTPQQRQEFRQKLRERVQEQLDVSNRATTPKS